MADEFQTLFAGQDVVDQVLNDFQDSWRRDEPPSLTDFLKRIQDQPRAVRETLRIRLIRIDQAVRWQLWRRQTDALTRTLDGSGKSAERSVPRRGPLLEDYARNCPEIGPVDSLPLELVVNEYQLRVECCDHPKLDEYQRRFPKFAMDLPTAIMAMLLDADTAVTGPDGLPVIETVLIEGVGTKVPAGESTLPMQPAEKPQRNRPVEFDTEAPRPDGGTLAEPADLAGAGTKLSTAETKAPKLPAAMPQRDRPVESDHAGIGPGGETMTEPEDLKGTDPKSESGGTTVPMQPSEMPRRNRLGVLPVPAGKQFGQYELLYEIARGAMGVVYKARHVKIDRPVALKMILTGQLASSKEIELFQREAQNAGRLVHDNIVPIFDAGEIGGQHFIAMAFIEGQSLAGLVREKPLSPQHAAEIVEQVSRALHYAHTQPQPVYHRDIKPANILMDTSGKPFVTDFGIAKRVEGKDSKATSDGIILGTPSYMPAEQAKGLAAEIGPWSDVYSTGAVLYHLLTGKPPFLADTVMETLRQVLQEETVSPRQLNHQVDADLEAVCLKCLEKDWHKRYQSAQELADDLNRFLSHEPTKARPLSSLGRLARWCRRNPAVAALTITTALLLIGITVGATILARSESAAKTAAQRERDKNAALARSESAAKIDAQGERDQKVGALKVAEVAKKEAVEQRKIAEEKTKDAENRKKEADESAEKARKAEATANAALIVAEGEKVKAETAKTNADVAAKAAKVSESLAQTEKNNAEAARDLAQKNLQHAISTVDQLLTFTADEGLKDLPGGEVIRKGLAQAALRQLDQFRQANPKDRQMQLALAKVKHVEARLLYITQNAEVDDVFKKTIELFATLLDSLREDSKPNDPKPIDVMVELAATHRDYGDSLTDRSLRDPSVATNLLQRALTQYQQALDLRVKVSTPDLRLEFELARVHLSRSISRFYLHETATSLEDVRLASQAFDGLIKKQMDPDTKRKTQRLLASSLRTIVHEESELTTIPPQGKLQEWFGQLDRAKQFQVELLQQNPASVELRFDLALTRFEKAHLLATKAKQADEALKELSEARDSFSNLAKRFEEIPKYELHRILSLELSAIVLASKAKLQDAARDVQEADKSIRQYNLVYPTVKRDKDQLRIADLAKIIGEDLLRNKGSK